MLHCGVRFLYYYTPKTTNHTDQTFLRAIRQTVRIVGMDHPHGVLRTGDRANVQFEFISRPEFVKEGMKLLFREGKTKVSLCLVCFKKILDNRRSGIRRDNQIVVILLGPNRVQAVQSSPQSSMTTSYLPVCGNVTPLSFAYKQLPSKNSNLLMKF